MQRSVGEGWDAEASAAGTAQEEGCNGRPVAQVQGVAAPA